METEIVINHDGDTWKVLSVGAHRDGKFYCHLLSTTRFYHQKNGKNPVQMGVWIDGKELRTAQNNNAC